MQTQKVSVRAKAFQRAPRLSRHRSALAYLLGDGSGVLRPEERLGNGLQLGPHHIKQRTPVLDCVHIYRDSRPPGYDDSF